MSWVAPKHSSDDVDKAGNIIGGPNSTAIERNSASDVINNWRASHGFPLNTFQTSLRDRALKVDEGAIVAQRIKRLPSIEAKIARYPQIRLSTMQDIGGCRAIVNNVISIGKIVSLYDLSRMKHVLDKSYDYVNRPKSSGYRGYHLAYIYRSDRKETYNGLRIEVQIRTIRQHSWATAVETVGTFTNQSLKSSVGDKNWLRFFSLMGTAHAMNEGTKAVPNTPSDQRALRAELRDLVDTLDVVTKLNLYSTMIDRTFEENLTGAHYFLMDVDLTAKTRRIWGYTDNELGTASSHYEQLERSSVGGARRDVVLVSVAKIDSLRRAYPNYFADTNEFVKSVMEVIT